MPRPVSALAAHREKSPLTPWSFDMPPAKPGAVVVRVLACGLCHSDLHMIDNDWACSTYPLVPGHEVVGVVERAGPGAERFAIGRRVGVPWLGWTCGECRYCRAGRENLCDRPRFTGYTLDGGYAEFILADQRYCFPIPDEYSDAEAAPLLCAGLIGYRSLVMAGDARRLGIYGSLFPLPARHFEVEWKLDALRCRNRQFAAATGSDGHELQIAGRNPHVAGSPVQEQPRELGLDVDSNRRPQANELRRIDQILQLAKVGRRHANHTR